MLILSLIILSLELLLLFHLSPLLIYASPPSTYLSLSFFSTPFLGVEGTFYRFYLISLCSRLSLVHSSFLCYYIYLLSLLTTTPSLAIYLLSLPISLPSLPASPSSHPFPFSLCYFLASFYWRFTSDYGELFVVPTKYDKPKSGQATYGPAAAAAAPP